RPFSRCPVPARGSAFQKAMSEFASDQFLSSVIRAIPGRRPDKGFGFAAWDLHNAVSEARSAAARSRHDPANVVTRLVQLNARDIGPQGGEYEEMVLREIDVRHFRVAVPGLPQFRPGRGIRDDVIYVRGGSLQLPVRHETRPLGDRLEGLMKRHP